MRILAFNTVTELCSVALLIDQKIYNVSTLAPYLHAEIILPMINQLLVDTGIELQSLDCIVLDQGPGSFIGVRLGLSIAQGLALGLDLPLIAVSSLEVLAQKAWRICSMKNVISTIDARMNKLYWSCFTRQISTTNGNEAWICTYNASLIDAITAKNIVYTLRGKWMLIGTGWNTNPYLESCLTSELTAVTEKQVTFPEAQDMLSLSISLYRKKMFVDLNQIDLMYLYDNIAKGN